jgi:hypothetical protein
MSQAFATGPLPRGLANGACAPEPRHSVLVKGTLPRGPRHGDFATGTLPRGPRLTGTSSQRPCPGPIHLVARISSRRRRCHIRVFRRLSHRVFRRRARHLVAALLRANAEVDDWCEDLPRGTWGPDGEKEATFGFQAIRPPSLATTAHTATFGAPLRRRARGHGARPSRPGGAFADRARKRPASNGPHRKTRAKRRKPGSPGLRQYGPPHGLFCGHLPLRGGGLFQGPLKSPPDGPPQGLFGGHLQCLCAVACEASFKGLLKHAGFLARDRAAAATLRPERPFEGPPRERRREAAVEGPLDE